MTKRPLLLRIISIYFVFLGLYLLFTFVYGLSVSRFSLESLVIIALSAATPIILTAAAITAFMLKRISIYLFFGALLLLAVQSLYLLTLAELFSGPIIGLAIILAVIFYLRVLAMNGILKSLIASPILQNVFSPSRSLAQ